MEEVLIQNALAYAAGHQLQLAERLGFGVHGIIFVAEDKAKGGKTAIKAHRELEPCLRERAVYERLKQAGVTEVLGFNPAIHPGGRRVARHRDEHCHASVRAGFCGRVSGRAAGFPGRNVAEWEAGKREQFEARWPAVEAVLAALENWTFTWWMCRQATSRSPDD